MIKNPTNHTQFMVCSTCDDHSAPAPTQRNRFLPIHKGIPLVMDGPLPFCTIICQHKSWKICAFSWIDLVQMNHRNWKQLFLKTHWNLVKSWQKTSVSFFFLETQFLVFPHLEVKWFCHADLNLVDQYDNDTKMLTQECEKDMTVEADGLDASKISFVWQVGKNKLLGPKMCFCCDSWCL